MPSVADINDRGIFHLRTAVAVQIGNLRKRAQHIRLCEHLRGRLHAVHRRRNLLTNFREQLIFQLNNALLRLQHGVFILLELLGNIPLAVRKGLLADVMRRNMVGMLARYFNIVAEHAVVADLQLLYAGRLALALLDRGNFSLSAG